GALGPVVEYSDELEARTEGFEVLAQRRDPYILGVLQLRDRPLGHVKTPSQLCLAHRLGVAQLVEPDFLKRLGPLGREPFLGARSRFDLLAKLGERGPGHQINPSLRSSAKYVS